MSQSRYSEKALVEAVAMHLAHADGWTWQQFPTAGQQRKMDKYRATAVGLVKFVIDERDKGRKAMARLAAEFGYKQCEQGHNIQKALANFDELYGAEP